MITYNTRIPIKHNIANLGNEFWNKCVYVEREKEYQCILEQVIHPNVCDRRFYDGLEDLKSVKIFKKRWSNILYCKHDESLVSKQIVENSKKELEEYLKYREESLTKLSDK